MLARLDWNPDRPERPNGPSERYQDDTRFLLLTLAGGAVLVVSGIIAMQFG